MGVVYKLTEDVVRFIVDRKGTEPRLSCREIADLVAGQYQKVVSKSSVHDVLKEHGVVIPRGRKPLDRARDKPKAAKFQIPLEKKQQLFVNVPAIVAPTPPPAVITPAPHIPPSLTFPAKGEGIERAGEIFIQAVFWDIFPRPLWGIKRWEDIRSLKINDLRGEWAYVSIPVERFKIDLEDGSFFEVDSRFQCFGAPPAPPLAGAGIERSTQEAADLFVNNIEPLCIRAVDEHIADTAVLDLVRACEGTPGKGMTSVSLLGKDNVVLTQFVCSPRQKKKFIIGISEKSKVVYEGINIRNIVYKVEQDDNKDAIISNIDPHTSDDNIIKIFKERHPPTPLNMSPFQDEQDQGGDISSARGGSAFGGDQQAWVLARLKARAQALFPSGFGQDTLESVFALRGLVQHDRTAKYITLLMPASDAFSIPLGQAADNVNALSVHDENGLRIICKIALENNANF